jgi:hypothetical protein
MANYYVRSLAAGTADGSSWANAYLTLAAALSAAASAAGDTFWVADDHAETQATQITLTSKGTNANPCIILCVNTHVTQPPTAKGTLATITTTVASNINFAGFAYCYGITFKAGSGGSSASFNFNPTTTFGWKMEACALQLINTNTSARLFVGLGASGSAKDAYLELFNTTIQFGSVSQGISPGSGRFIWRGTASALTGATLPTSLFLPFAGASGVAEVAGVDLSAMGSGKNLVSAGIANVAGLDIYFRNCELGASVGIITGTVTAQGGVRVFLENCNSGNVNYGMEHYKYQGSIVHETTIVRTGGASDGVTPISWKMVTLASGASFRLPLESPPIYIWNDTTGSAKILTIEFLHDSLTNLKNDDIWLNVEHLGTASLPLSIFADNRKADEFATAADQTTSSIAWTTTGLTNPNKQKLQVTVTPQIKGWFRLSVRLAKVSYTVYVDPAVTVS